MGRIANPLGIPHGFLTNGNHGIHKTIQCLFGLGLGGFNQQTFRYQQGKIDGWGIKTIIQQTLGKIQGTDAKLFGLGF